MNRVIGMHDDGIPGPLLVMFGAIHGNEPAGVVALSHLFDLFKLEIEYNPRFKLKGKAIGIVGNMDFSTCQFPNQPRVNRSK